MKEKLVALTPILIAYNIVEDLCNLIQPVESWHKNTPLELVQNDEQATYFF